MAGTIDNREIVKYGDISYTVADTDFLVKEGITKILDIKISIIHDIILGQINDYIKDPDIDGNEINVAWVSGLDDHKKKELVERIFKVIEPRIWEVYVELIGKTDEFLNKYNSEVPYGKEGAWHPI